MDFPPVTPGEGNYDLPDHSHVKRTMWIMLATGGSLLCILGGLHLALTNHAVWPFTGGVILLAVGLPLPLRAGAWLLRKTAGFFREQHGQCPHCGYHLAGLHSASCPECGHPVF